MFFSYLCKGLGDGDNPKKKKKPTTKTVMSKDEANPLSAADPGWAIYTLTKFVLDFFLRAYARNCAAAMCSPLHGKPHIR